MNENDAQTKLCQVCRQTAEYSGSFVIWTGDIKGEHKAVSIVEPPEHFCEKHVPKDGWRVVDDSAIKPSSETDNYLQVLEIASQVRQLIRENKLSPDSFDVVFKAAVQAQFNPRGNIIS